MLLYPKVRRNSLPSGFEKSSLHFTFKIILFAELVGVTAAICIGELRGRDRGFTLPFQVNIRIAPLNRPQLTLSKSFLVHHLWTVHIIHRYVNCAVEAALLNIIRINFTNILSIWGLSGKIFVRFLFPLRHQLQRSWLSCQSNPIRERFFVVMYLCVLNLCRYEFRSLDSNQTWKFYHVTMVVVLTAWRQVILLCVPCTWWKVSGDCRSGYTAVREILPVLSGQTANKPNTS
jgi:hypothetical protein